jgi:hypothetical protein
MALVMAPVTMWRDNRDSSNRVAALDENQVGYRYYLINPNRISDMIDLSTLQVAKSRFLFSDNHRDRRENNSLIECLLSPTQIQTLHDTDYASKFVTLPFFPKNDPTKTPVDTTIDVEDIAYFDAYNPDPTNYVWLVYNRKAFKRVEQLVNLNIDQAEDQVNDGSTTTTTTTTEARTTGIQ